MSFHDFMKSVENDIEAEFAGAKSELVADAEALVAKLKTDIPPVAYAILQAAVMAAEVTGGAWNVKLLTAVTTASAAFAQKGLPIVLNDIVAAITAIVGSMNKESAARATPHVAA